METAAGQTLRDPQSLSRGVLVRLLFRPQRGGGGGYPNPSLPSGGPVGPVMATGATSPVMATGAKRNVQKGGRPLLSALERPRLRGPRSGPGYRRCVPNGWPPGASLICGGSNLQTPDRIFKNNRPMGGVAPPGIASVPLVQHGDRSRNLWGAVASLRTGGECGQRVGNPLGGPCGCRDLYGVQERGL